MYFDSNISEKCHLLATPIDEKGVGGYLVTLMVQKGRVVVAASERDPDYYEVNIGLIFGARMLVVAGFEGEPDL